MSIDVYPPRNYTQYEEGSFTVTATGFSGTAPSGTARYVRIGKQVAISLPGISGTSNSTAFTLTGLPAALWITTAYSWPVNVMDNSVPLALPGSLAITASSGTLQLFKDFPGNLWTASGTKQFYATTITYLLP